MPAIADKMLFALPEFMIPSTDSRSDSGRPLPIRDPNSSSLLEAGIPDITTKSHRASTVQNGALPTVMADRTNVIRDVASNRSSVDVFENGSVDTVKDQGGGKLPVGFEDLPIELISLADSFIDSLSARVHPTPPTVERLSGLFQDFYVVAVNHINTHISAISSKQHRTSSPAPSISSISAAAGKLRAKAVSISNKEKAKPLSESTRNPEQQMVSAEEMTERKRARKVLEHKRVALEEAIESRVCEGIYERIWRHRSTQDEAQDDKLRSKTAALSVVGIGLTDLGVDIGQNASEDTASTTKRESEVRDWLEGARNELVNMNRERYPLGKLHRLKAAHKSIVDTLAHFHPSSSADEIMPMLIFTLITSPTEGLAVISNLYFIQRFRCESKIDGEAAYCLTNLEAAITFLETVDLASLREDEAPSGPVKADSRPATPTGRPSPTSAGPTVSSLSAPTLSSNSGNSPMLKASPSPSGLKIGAQTSHNRRLSDLFQPPAQAFGAASDAVLNTADHSFKSIGNSLGDSYKFLLGKLKERQENRSGRQNSEILVPKTLEDARKLVTTPPPEEDGSGSDSSSIHSPICEQPRSNSGASTDPPDDRLLSMITGKLPRDRSADRDSIRSVSSSSKKTVAFTQETSEKLSNVPSNSLAAPSTGIATPSVSPNPATAMAESMRNLGNTLNPMNRIAGMGMMRGFGRSPAPSPVPHAWQSPQPQRGLADEGAVNLATTLPELPTAFPPKELQKIAPPNKRFMEMQNPGDLKINEILELLRDYRRLAGALKALDVFSNSSHSHV